MKACLTVGRLGFGTTSETEPELDWGEHWEPLRRKITQRLTFAEQLYGDKFAAELCLAYLGCFAPLCWWFNCTTRASIIVISILVSFQIVLVIVPKQKKIISVWRFLFIRISGKSRWLAGIDHSIGSHRNWTVCCLGFDVRIRNWRDRVEINLKLSCHRWLHFRFLRWWWWQRIYFR